jgi:hypothetical protein
MTTQIKVIALNADSATVRYSLIDGCSVTDVVFPGKGSEPVLLANGFGAALEVLHAELVSGHSLPPDYEWVIKSITPIYDEETGECSKFKAQLSGFDTDLGKMTVVIDPQSEQNVSPELLEKLEAVISEAIAFTQGASAQLTLFAVDGGKAA